MANKPKPFRPLGSQRPVASLCQPQRLYGRAWARYRLGFLTKPENIFCRICQAADPPRDVLAVVVDHIVPYKGDQHLFWDKANHQPLCKQCHDRKTATCDGGFGRQLKASHCG